jgi:hypothetical protein
MKQLIKPRLIPLVGWAMLVVVGLFCAYVLYARPAVFLPAGVAPASPPPEKDAIELALKNLATIKSSSWLQRGASYLGADGAFETIAPAPEAAAVSAAQANLEPADPTLKGAVVVRSGKHLYLVLGPKRFRAGDHIATGETIRTLNLQSVELTSPEGRARTVEIGRGIGPAIQPSTW